VKLVWQKIKIKNSDSNDCRVARKSFSAPKVPQPSSKKCKSIIIERMIRVLLKTREIRIPLKVLKMEVKENTKRKTKIKLRKTC
jgi:hypothetical protein